MLLLSNTRHAERLCSSFHNAPSGAREGKPPSAAKWGFQLVIWLTMLAVALTVSPSAEAAKNKKPKVKIVKVAPVNEGAAVTLDGSLTVDPEGGPLTYAWTQIKGSPSIALNAGNTAKPTFTAPPIQKNGKKTKAAKFTFQLAVTDDQGLTAVKKATLNVKPLNAPPVANAGADISTGFSQNVALTSLSTDPDADRGGQIVKYQWKYLKKKGGPKIKLINPKAAGASFVSPSVPAQLEFQLTVTDNDKAKAVDTVIVSVAEEPLNASFSLDKKALSQGETATANASAIKGGKGPYKVKFEWGDGSAAEEVPLNAGETSKSRSHQYTKTGSFKQKVTVIDANGSVKSSTEETVTVGAPALNATLSVSASTIVKGGQVTAEAKAIAGGTSPYTVAFDWGDGSAVEQGQSTSANHTYAAAGSYNLKITVTDNAGGSKSQTFPITVSDVQVPALNGALTLTQSSVVFNNPVEAKVDITGGTEPYSVKFEWGDGQTTGPTQLNPGLVSATGQHFYEQVGSYTIKATITDANGGSKEVTTNVTVTPVDAPLTECQ
jgi:PKD repeat protein